MIPRHRSGGRLPTSGWTEPTSGWTEPPSQKWWKTSRLRERLITRVRLENRLHSDSSDCTQSLPSGFWHTGRFWLVVPWYATHQSLYKWKSLTYNAYLSQLLGLKYGRPPRKPYLASPLKEYAAVLAKPRRASRNVSDAATASLPSSTTTRFTRVDVAEVRELLTRYSRAYQLRRVTEAQDLREARMRRTFQKHSEITRMGPGLKPGDRAPGPGPGTRLDRAPCRADWPRAVRAPRPRAVPRWAQVLGSSR